MVAVETELAQLDRIADVLMAIEGVDIEAIRAAPLIVIETGKPTRAVIGLHVGSRHFRLAIDEVRTVAMAVRIERAIVEADAVAAGLEAFAGMAELLLLAERLRTMRATAGWASQ